MIGGDILLFTYISRQIIKQGRIVFCNGLTGASIGIGGTLLGAQVNLVVAGPKGDGSAGIKPLLARAGFALQQNP